MGLSAIKVIVPMFESSKLGQATRASDIMLQMTYHIPNMAKITGTFFSKGASLK